MKKYLVLILFSMTSTAFSCNSCKSVAEQSCPYMMNIVFKNNTGSDCHLIYQDIKAGKIFSRDVPLTIAVGQESKPYAFEDEAYYIGSDVVLGLQCGEDKFATFDSRKEITKDTGYIYSSRGAINVIGSVSSMSNMDAIPSEVKAQCTKKGNYTPATIYWTLY